MKHPLLEKIEREQLRKELPEFREGDTVNVHVVIREGDKERVQQFKGTCIARDGGIGATATFTVRRFSLGSGVERVFPLHSPHVEKVDVVRRGKVRRAKLYYLRNLAGKKARVSEARGPLGGAAKTAASAAPAAPAKEPAAAED